MSQPAMASIHYSEHRARAWTMPFRRYERHISAAAMVLGFAVDNVTFGRIDHPGPHVVFLAYLAAAAISIALAHALQARADQREAQRLAPSDLRMSGDDAGVPGDSDGEGKAERPSRMRLWLPAITQFALGGLWSGFLVFYWRSAAVSTSWPFLLLLLGFLVGNEVFRRYHARLVFAVLLLFFALYSYAVFVVPVFTRTIGVGVFLLSGAVAAGTFAGFLALLKSAGGARYRQSRWKILGGAVLIAAAMNGFYFGGILPPLPLALSDAGVYLGIRHTGSVYVALAESETWLARVGLSRPVVHVAPGQKIAVYSAVFAPIKMNTTVSHKWDWWDSRSHRWRTRSVVSFPISGGRARGYRGYSLKSDAAAGDWRVEINADDGRRIGTVAFTVSRVAAPVETSDKILQ